MSAESAVLEAALRKAAYAISGDNREPRLKDTDSGMFDIVTSSDLKAEKTIIDTILSHFPGDTIISEETRSDAEETGRFWAVDPIDGTVNYSRRIPLYGIQIVFCENREPKASGIYLPEYGELYTADESGAFLNGRPLRTARPRPLRECIMSTGDFSRKSESFRKAQASLFSHCYDEVARFKVFGAACTDFAFLASGRTDIHIRFTNKIWDYLPGLYLAETAGAVYDRKLLKEKKCLILCSSEEVLAEAKEKILPSLLPFLRHHLLLPPIMTR
ncbi:MAG: inositol monophosphatase [Candidatus Methanomethylophilaceae archaeon]|nr:inositol monophosphatase [Candidatus Methanomethylophilaceae archaeon]